MKPNRWDAKAVNIKPNIYDFLDPIMKRPHMYVNADSISELETFLSGFQLGFQLMSGQLKEPPISTLFMFQEWFGENFNTGICKSIYDYLRATSQSEKQALERFCSIYKKFRGH